MFLEFSNNNGKRYIRIVESVRVTIDGKRVTRKKTIKNIIDSIIGCIGIVIVCLLLKVGISSLMLRTILSVILSIGMYAAILVFLKDEMAMEYLSKVIERIKNR